MGKYLKIADVDVEVGDTVSVNYRIIEREKKAGTTKRSTTEEIKERIQPFEGKVIKISGSHEDRSFTVRKMATDGIGVERIFPAKSPWVKGIKIVSKGKVRRAKLYYLRPKK